MDIIQSRAVEGSTLVITCTFESDDGSAVTPASNVEWTVRKTDGTQVSSGSVSAAETVYVVIKGSDLSAGATSGDSQTMTLILETTYNSARGTGLPVVKMCKFTVDNELGVP